MRTERIISSIPKDESSEITECPHTKNTNISCPATQNSTESQSAQANWVYPSPKMFWDAMNHKGTLPLHLSDPESPKTQEELEWIVTIHNVVNEQCWQEICKWERFRIEGCSKSDVIGKDPTNKIVACTPVLQRFLGRPDDLSPRAWFKSTILGYRRPFDRHDWYIRTQETAHPPRRYIIDFYAGGGKDAVSSFYLDVRPAVDTFDAIKLRASKYFCEKLTAIKNVFNK